MRCARWRELLAYNFNDDPETLIMEPPIPATDDRRPADQPSTPTPEPSAAFIRFRSCRWHQPPESGNAEFCTHREVKPYAGTTSFDADAWCPDCRYYKLRRVPKKRAPEDYSY